MTNAASRRAILKGIAASGVLMCGRARAAGAPVAQTRHGKVSGMVRNGASVFLGIPYGAPTGAANRFLPPKPPVSWRGTRDATKLGERSPQPPGRIYDSPMIGPYMAGGRDQELIAMDEPEGENCLVLNVLTPAVDHKRRPVMVYFHGGGFTSGSGAVMSLSDRLVTEQNVVLVTVNHRLGPLGFLYLGGLSQRYAEGNPGMLDLVASLEWVRDNIAAFGGDPAKVTIFGESGGAAKVALLVAMPQAKGLFRGAIMQSGLIPQPVAPAQGDEVTRKAIADLGGSAPDLTTLLSRPHADIVKAGIAAGPVADGRTLVADPWRAAPAAAANVPMIIGYCADEATLFAGVPDPSTFSLDWTMLSPKLASKLPLSETQLTPVISAYRSARPGDNASDIFFRIMSDGVFVRAMIKMTDLKASQKPPVFFYRMNYDTQLAPGLRAFHTAELPLVGRLVLQSRAEKLSRHLSAAWAAFARTGKPDVAGFPRWQPHKPTGKSLMMFDENSHFGNDPEWAAQQKLIAALGDAVVPLRPPLRSS